MLVDLLTPSDLVSRLAPLLAAPPASLSSGMLSTDPIRLPAMNLISAEDDPWISLGSWWRCTGGLGASLVFLGLSPDLVA